MTQPSPLRSAVRNFATLFRAEASQGLLLIAVAVAAMMVANSPLAEPYFHLFHAPLWPKDSFYLNTVHLWINDAMMAVFFFVVGLEVKRELIDGNLSQPSARNLPILAAAAGMAVPMLVYLIVSGGAGEYRAGMAIPAATDIAFAMGLVGLLGTRVPKSLRLFLLTVAIVDDIGAVAIIALFYSEPRLDWLLGSAAVLAALGALGRLNVDRLWPYLLGAVLLWYCVLNSGVHATIAGVLAAFTLPMQRRDGSAMLLDVEHALVPWNAWLVVPVFGFANAGVSLAGLGAEALLDPLPLAVAAGLVIGKQLGIFTMVWTSVRLGWVERPTGSTWPEVWGISILCGIGFTMSLFIGELAFPGSGEAARLLRDEAKIGILTGSLVSALLGYAVLRLVTRRRGPEADDPSDPVV